MQWASCSTLRGHAGGLHLHPAGARHTRRVPAGVARRGRAAALWAARCWRCFPASGTTLRPRRVVLPAACAICATPRGRKPRRAAAASGPVLPYFKNGVHAYRHLIGGALRYLMPAAALCVLVFTVQEVLGPSFAGRELQRRLSLYSSKMKAFGIPPKKMVQERVMASEGAKVEWDEHPVFELRIVDPPPAPAPATWWTRSSRHPQTRS